MEIVNNGMSRWLCAAFTFRTLISSQITRVARNSDIITQQCSKRTQTSDIEDGAIMILS
jgi:hypothetical protein